MPEPTGLTDHYEDERRNHYKISSGSINNLFDIIEFSQDPEFITNAETIAILFSGNLNEAKEVRQILRKKGNNTCKILALDKNQPQTLNEKAHRINAELIEADCINLKLPPDSIDIIIAHGAEYLFRDDFEARITIANGVYTALKSKGLIYAPGFGDTVFRIDKRFRQLTGITDIYQKI